MEWNGAVIWSDQQPTDGIHAMNFLTAIKHAVIGYGIYRREWITDTTPPRLILHLDHDGLRWTETPDGRPNVLLPPVKLLGPDINYDLLEKDITATDWDTI